MDKGLTPDRGKEFSIRHSTRPALRPTQPTIQWAPRIKKLEHIADHSPAFSAEV